MRDASVLIVPAAEETWSALATKAQSLLPRLREEINRSLHGDHLVVSEDVPLQGTRWAIVEAMIERGPIAVKPRVLY
jgi:hypothetical protein